MINIEFARIDARDDAYTGYQTVAFVTTQGSLNYGPKNGRLQLQMEKEYLTSLYLLQQQIKGKYLPLWDAQESPTQQDRCACPGLTLTQYDECMAQLNLEFPSPEAAYYT